MLLSLLQRSAGDSDITNANRDITTTTTTTAAAQPWESSRETHSPEGRARSLETKSVCNRVNSGSGRHTSLEALGICRDSMIVHFDRDGTKVCGEGCEEKKRESEEEGGGALL